MDLRENLLFQTWISKPFFGAYSVTNKGNFEKQLAPVYCKASNVLEVLELNPGCPLNTIIDLTDVKNKEVARVVSLVFERNEELKYIISKIGKYKFEGMSMADCKVLIAEMLWGKQYLKNLNIHIETVRYHEETIRDLFLEVINVINNPIDQDKCKFPTYVRINTLSISVNDALNAFYKEGWNLIPRSKSYANYSDSLANLGKKDFIRDFHISELLAFPPGTSFVNHPGFLKGKFVIQDKGSCLSSFLLNPKPGSVVLDAAAAPGLKTNHLANIMNNTGFLYANDIHPDRLKMLHNLMVKTNVTNTLISEENYFKLSLDKEKIEYILVDPPTLYTGIFLLANRSYLTPFLRHNCFKLGVLLRYMLQTFPNVKRVVYTTCSVYAEEGEKVVDDAIKEVGESYTLLDAKQMLWDEWRSTSLPEYICGHKCIRTRPEYDQCQGWFIAVFERNFNIPVPPFRFKRNLINESIKETPKFFNNIHEDKSYASPNFSGNLQQQSIEAQKLSFTTLRPDITTPPQSHQNNARTLVTLTKTKSQRKKERRKLKKTLASVLTNAEKINVS